jgi:Na+-translocating ferredoxin:NAD+ oxidoreductase RnfE subunit
VLSGISKALANALKLIPVFTLAILSTVTMVDLLLGPEFSQKLAQTEGFEF